MSTSPDPRTTESEAGVQAQEVRQDEHFRDFYEAVAQHYPEEDIVYRSLRGAVRKNFILRHLADLQGRLLDIGCNRGSYASVYSGGSVVGVDISLTALRAAAERVPRGSFVLADAQQLSCLASSAFDVVLCSEVLEHLLAPDRVFQACYRVLRPGGTLLLTTPNYKKTRPTWVEMGQLAEHGIRGPQEGKYYHSAFRPGELDALARAAGFGQVSVGTFEKEVKYATRVPVLFFHTVNKLNGMSFCSKGLDSLNRKFLESSSLFLYSLAVFLKVDPFLQKLVREGVRSFLLATK